ncbi:MAG: HD family phosphohydrolase [Pseudanabaenaceae cyanobacterium]
MSVSRGIACSKSKSLWRKLIFCSTGSWVCRGLVIVAVVSLSLILCIPYYAQPQLAVGTFVERDILAPVTAPVQDIEATARAKELAREKVTPVYRIDRQAETASQQHLQDLLSTAEQVRTTAGPLPFLPLEVMSWRDQLRLLELTEASWQTYSPEALLLLVQPSRRELYKSQTAEQHLHLQITLARQRYQQAMAVLESGPELFRSSLLRLADPEWQELKQLWQEGLKELLAGGLPAGLPREMLTQRVLSWRGMPRSEPNRTLTLQVFAKVLKPNLKLDYTSTTREMLLAEESVQPLTIEVRAGEVLVRAGEQITERQFVILDGLGLTQRQPNWGRIAVVVLSTGLAIALLMGLVQARVFKWRNADGLAMLIAVGTIALAGVLMLPQLSAFLPLASVGLIVGSFYCRRSAVLITTLLAGLLWLSRSPEPAVYLPIVLGGITAGLLTNRPRSRSYLAGVGILVGVVQALTFIALNMLTGAIPLMLVLSQALVYGAGGLISAILALGAIPYLEQISYALTPFRLAELADLDRPLLRRLVTEAPGTFQHTLFVANLAEAAARELNADTALVRTGTLYHDIGKTLHPEYFIENQMGQANPHDQINDPWRSAQIIKEHVSGGLKLAQQYRLPKQLQAFIPEHQGTIIISYFYSQALQQFPNLSADEFRYGGPIPQSKETGIVMLADACEAALRSLGQDVELESAREMVMRIFHARWDDGQLRDSGLTWAELERIADVFLRVWRERNHGRIKYPPFVKKVDPTGSQLEETEISAKGAT